MYFVKFSFGDKEKILFKCKSKDEAYLKAERAQKKLCKKGKDGIISVYVTSDTVEMPLRMIYGFWIVAPSNV